MPQPPLRPLVRPPQPPADAPLPSPLRHPAAHVRARFARWWQARLPLSDVQTLTQRNVYILPTRAGFMLAATLLVLLIAAINYQLNLGYLLTFLLAGSALAGMHLCHGNLRGLTLALASPQPQFCGRPVALTITLGNARARARYGLALGLLDSDVRVWCDVPGRGNSTVTLSFTPQQRGRVRVPVLSAETRFPLGTFRVWTVWRPAATVLVYPQPEADPPPLPPGQPQAQGALSRTPSSSGEFEGVRAYQRGDPLKRIVWKKSAGREQLVSRDTEHTQHQQLWLDAAHTGLPDPEAQLARLCAWVLQAEVLGVDYGLRLPHTELAPDHGPAHRLRCLEALALC